MVMVILLRLTRNVCKINPFVTMVMVILLRLTRNVCKINPFVTMVMVINRLPRACTLSVLLNPLT